MILEKAKSLSLKDFSRRNEADSFQLEFLKNFIRINHIYSSAMQVASTQLEILDSEFAAIYDHSPIHHMERRIKSVESILEKMERKRLEINVDNVYKIQDIAGIRVVCSYVDDIYYLRGLLVGGNGFQLIRESDYIKNPKPNGYRSLHLILNVPFVISEGKMELPVEIQLRTIAMDMWASLEHELHYKSDSPISDQDLRELARCADTLSEVDRSMQELFRKVTDAERRGDGRGAQRLQYN